QAVGGRIDSGPPQCFRGQGSGQPVDSGGAQAARFRCRAAAAHAGLGQGRRAAWYRAQQGPPGRLRRRRSPRHRSREGHELFEGRRLLQVSALERLRSRERLQGAGLDAALPYLLLAPSILVTLIVLVYPLWDGLRASTQFYRYGKALRDIGL